MLIPVLTEPHFRSYLWAGQTMEGISQEAARRKYKVISLDTEAYESYGYDTLFGEDRRLLIVIGTSISWMPEALSFFTRKKIETVFISFDPAETTLPTGMVRMDYVGAIDRLLRYLQGCGRNRIALYGYNQNSSADTIKARYFQKWCHQRGLSSEDRIFYNNGSLPGCYRIFLPEARRFDALICANDIVAVSLLSRLKEDGLRVPEDLFVTAFGDSLMASRISPSLTIATLDHREMGRQAVMLFSTLYRQRAAASVSVRVKSHLIIRESTACMQEQDAPLGDPIDAGAFRSNINFYADPEAERLLRAETLLSACDDLDLRLLEGLLEGQPLDEMERQLFLTRSALQYRRRCLVTASGCRNTQEFSDFIRFCRSHGVL